MSAYGNSSAVAVPPKIARNQLQIFRSVVVILVLLLLLLVLYPIGRMVLRSVYADQAWQFAAFFDVLSSDWLPGVVADTGITVAVSGFCALCIASLFAWINERTDASLGVFGNLIPLVPLLIPHVAIAIGWTFLLNEKVGFISVALDNLLGSWLPAVSSINIYSWGGLISLYTMFLVPYAYVIVASAFKNVDPALEEASRVSGGSMWRTATKISLPSIAPAIIAAGLLLVIEGLSLYSAAVIIAPTAGIDILSVRMVRMLTVTYPPDLAGSLVLGMMLMAVILFIWVFQRKALMGGNFAKVSGRARADSMVKLGALRWPARMLILSYMMAASILPLAALILVSLQPYWTGTNIFANLSFQHYEALFWGGGSEIEALRNSVLIGVVGATMSMLVAAVLVIYIKSAKPVMSKVADGVSKLPAALPHVVIAIGFLLSFGAAPFHLSGTVMMLLMAYLVIYMPQASIAASVAGGQVGNDLTEASAICGAGGGRTFFRISLPLMSPGLIAGWGLLFVLMAGELTAASILANARAPVVGFVILEIFESGSYGTLAALASVVSLLSAVVIVCVGSVFVRRTQ
ncbi:ABC transporter permease [Devosia naphthalenivorans]|uniref:ABC transporter permease n=1 Tax=Devosia naphthalenivorans TaxID=2082392 RepID=UPI000D34F33B|nr:ABC transporter permease subunit [Devosia naphthalenivorans]